MTKQEYIKRLENALSKIPSAEITKITDYYSEMIDDRIDDGMTEKEAVASLESPETVAEKELAENVFNVDNENTTPPSKRNARQKKQVEYDYNGENLFIDARIDDVFLNLSNDNKIHIYYYDGKKTGYELKNENNNIKLKFSINKNGFSLFGMFIGIHSRPVEIFLPKNFSGKLNIKTDVGDINFLNDNDIKPTELYLQATTGDIKIKNVNASSVSIKTTTGDISVENYFGDLLTLNSTTGNIHFNSIIVKGVKTKATVGRISFKDLHAEEMDINTTTGDIKGEIKGSRADYNLLFKSSIGKANFVNQTTSENKSIRIETTIGDANIKFEL